MNIQVDPSESWTRVTLEGRLDVAGVNAIKDTFSFHVTSSNRPAVIDCGKVSFVASLGIGLFVAAAKSLQRKSLPFVLLWPSPLVEETLRAAGLHHIVEIVHEDPSGGAGNP